MKVFHPKAEVRLIKAYQRDELATGLTAVASRYAGLKTIDLTPYLSDTGGLQVGKALRSPMGYFSLSLADKMHSLQETLAALIEPMDIVEIRMAHDPSIYSRPGEASRVPIVMRGFVTGIRRVETMSGGQPMRSVVITGNDFGKALEILRIYYLMNSVVGDIVLSELKFFQKYAAQGADKIMPAATFVQLVLDNIVTPYLGYLTQLADGRALDAKVINKITAEVSIDGVVSPLSVSAFAGGSVWQFLSEFLDVGTFNEMFLDEREEGIVLVVRPNAFRDAQGSPINPGTEAATVLIDAEDIEASTLTRSDMGVANYYWVTNQSWQINENQGTREMSQRGSDEFYAPFSYVNCAVRKYGYRKMEVSSAMGPPTQSNVDAQGVATTNIEADKLLAWLEDRRVKLAASNKDNVVFEEGSMEIRGNEKVKPGMELLVRRGTAVSRYYVTAVNHSFMPFAHFKTSITVERGTGFIDRAQNGNSPYLAELTLKGAV
jgi:hypothetical protein